MAEYKFLKDKEDQMAHCISLIITLMLLHLSAMDAKAAQVYVNCGAENGTININVTNPGAGGNAACNAPANRHAIEYKVGSQNLISGNLLHVNFSGVAFNGGSVRACANATAAELSHVIPDAGTSNYYFIISAPVTRDQYIYFTSDTCVGAANDTLNIRYNLTNIPSGAGNVTITALSSGNIPLDTAGSARIITSSGSCNNTTVSPTLHNLTYTGGARSFNIASSNTAAGNTTQCLWYASPAQERYWDTAAGNYAWRTADWVAINNWSGVGTGTINYNASAYNGTASRWARIALSSGKEFTIIQIGQNQSNLSITKGGTGSGSVTASAGNITWYGNIGTADYLQGASVTLTAAPLGTSTFAGWTGDCTGMSNTCTLNMDTSKSVFAIFNSPASPCNYTVDPPIRTIGTAGGTGRITVTAPSAPECTNQSDNWVAVSDAAGNWIEFAYDCDHNVCFKNTFSGQGSGIITYRVNANQSQNDRTAIVSVSSSPQSSSVRQTVSGCFSCGINFTDVPLGHWAHDYVNAIVCAGITVGCGSETYCPSEYVTNAQAAAFTLRAMEGEPPYNYCYNGGGWFLDNPIGGDFCSYIRRLAELQVVSECSNGYFCPNNLIMRSSIAEILIKGLGISVPDDYCLSGSPFTDVSVNHPKCKYIKKLYELGITTGCRAGLFCTNDFATRDQMAAFLYRAFLKNKCQ